MRIHCATFLLFSVYVAGCNRPGPGPSAPKPVLLDASAGRDTSPVHAFGPCEYAKPTPPLHAAVLAHDIKMIQSLLDSGSTVHDRNDCGETPLMWAFSLEVAQLSKSLHPTRAEIATESRRMEQANALRMQTAMWLLDHGANAKAIDSRGDSVVAHAARFGSGGAALLAVLGRLVKAGADVNQRNYKGHTPLMQASLTGRPEVVSYLLNHGADRALSDNNGKTALDLAEETRDPKMVKALEP